MSFNRRQFLTFAGTTLSSLAIDSLIPGLQIKANANPMNPNQPEHFFVLMRSEGGMDVTLGLDPQVYGSGISEADMFIEYSPEAIFRSGSLALGPAAAPLQMYAQDIATINGIFLSESDLGHDSRYLAHGSLDQRVYSYPYSLARSEPFYPFGVITKGGGGDSQSSGVPYNELDDLARGQLTDNLGVVQTATLWADINNPQSNLGQIQRSVTKTAVIGPDFGKYMGSLDTGADSNLNALAAAFATGGAKQAELSLGFNVGLDTHNDHKQRHLAAQLAVWQQVARVFAVFKKAPYKQGSLFDATTFMVVSDMSRTPALNSQGGKDHNALTNSVLMAGKKVNGGTNVGASIVIPQKVANAAIPLHRGAPFDFESGRVAATREMAKNLTPENIAKTLAEMFGNPSGFKIDPTTKSIKPLIKG